MIRYQVIALQDPDMFVKTINQMIRKGWLPQGGVCVLINNYVHEYYQAMMIEEQVKEL